MDTKGIAPFQNPCKGFSPLWNMCARMRLMSAALMTPGWKPNVLLLNYSRLIAVDRIELSPQAHEARMLKPLHYTAFILFKI